MTQRFRVVAAGEPAGAEQPGRVIVPERPLATPRPQAVVEDELATNPAGVALPAHGPQAPASKSRGRGGSGEAGRGGGMNRGVVAAAVVAIGVVVIGAGVSAALQSGSSKPAAERKPASAAAAPAGSQSGVPSPKLSKGRIVSYSTTTREQGYFEGVLTLTNRTKAPITQWQMSFSYPGADFKNIWGGVLAKGGANPIIKGDPATGPIPVGGKIQVRFGAAGTPSAPQGCTLNGQPC